MARVSIRTLEQTKPAVLPSGYSGSATSREYFGARETHLKLQVLELQRADSLVFDEVETDRVAYVWRGSIEVRDHRLGSGSSFIVEHGRTLALSGLEGPAVLLVFAANEPNRQSRAGGHVHLLPTEKVPRSPDLGGTSGVGGGMHADSACATCEVWLHENSFPGLPESQRVDVEAGIHSHTEDEIIFVTAGQMRLGSKLLGPGTALSISANTLYSFIAGPEGLSFVNFRANAPGAIAFPSRAPMDERSYWSSRLPRPIYTDL
jgi:hypothetical protein